jgi:hypothetical protein
MTFKSGADGITKKGKTKGKNLGDSGPNVGTDSLKKKLAGTTNDDMKSMGRNLARVANQKRG